MKRIHILLLAFILGLTGCSSMVTIKVDSGTPENAVEKIRTLSYDPAEVSTIDTPIQARKAAEKYLGGGLRLSGNDVSVDPAAMNRVEQITNYFMYQQNTRVYGWMNHNYLPILLRYGAKAAMYSGLTPPRSPSGERYPENGFQHWNAFLSGLYLSQYYSNTLPKVAQGVMEQRVYDNPDPDRVRREIAIIMAACNASNKRSNIIDKGYLHFQSFKQYIAAIIMKHELTQKNANANILCRAKRILDALAMETDDDYLVELYRGEAKSAARRLNRLGVPCR